MVTNGTADLAQQNGHENGAASLGTSIFGAMQLDGIETMPTRPAEGTGANNEYSAFIHKKAELLQTLYGVIMEGNIDDPDAQLLNLKLFRAFEREWDAEACNCQGLIEEYNATAEYWRKQFRHEDVASEDDQGRPLPTVEGLLRRWNTAANILAEAYVQKKRYGLPHVRKTLAITRMEDRIGENGEREQIEVAVTARERLEEARRVMSEVRFQAASLPPARNQYFWAMVQAHRIAIDRNVDVALGIPVVDYTQVKKDLAGGLSVHLAIWRMPWAYKEMYARVFGSMADGQTMRDFLTTNQIQQWPYDRRPPKTGGGKGLLGLLRRDDDDEEEEVDDRSPKERQRDRGKERDEGKKRGGRNNRGRR